MKPSPYNRYAETTILAYLAGTLFFTILLHRFIPGWGALAGIQLAAGAFLLGWARLQDRFPGNRLLAGVRAWLPLPYVLFGYRLIHFLVCCDRNCGLLPDRDCWLIAADRFLFGTDPTIWLQRIVNPILTEAMQIIYATNYFLPAILVLALYLSRDRTAFQHSVWVLTLGYILSYLGYFIIPAIGPRLTLEHAIPLQGVMLREKLAALNYALEAVPRDCFPSGHTELPLVTLWLAFRHRRPLARVYLPIVLLLICSTVYLRYHYVIDVLAGAALAGIVILAGRATLPPGGQAAETSPELDKPGNKS